MKSMLRCIVIDDNQPAVDLIESYINKLYYLEFVKGFTNPVDAMNELDTLDADLIFLDMQMPEMSGLDFLKAIKPKQFIVVISDYKEYAFDTYEINTQFNIKIIDYLSKIIEFDRFVAACEKVSAKYLEVNSFEEDFILLKDNTSTHKIRLKDILYFKPGENKNRHKIKVELENQKQTIHIRESLDEIENNMNSKGFIRIHRSAIVAIHHIKEIISKDDLRMADGEVFIISDNYRKAFFKKLSQFQLLGSKSDMLKGR